MRPPMHNALILSNLRAKNYIFWATFLLQKVWCIFNHFYVVCSERYQIRWNYSQLRANMPFKVIQGHRFWYQSKAHMRLPISD